MGTHRILLIGYCQQSPILPELCMNPLIRASSLSVAWRCQVYRGLENPFLHRETASENCKRDRRGFRCPEKS